jgi:hypothetical protein
MVLASWVERDGLARSVLVVLAMTTIACFSYTWGYYEVSVVGQEFAGRVLRAGVYLQTQ